MPGIINKMNGNPSNKSSMSVLLENTANSLKELADQKDHSGSRTSISTKIKNFINYWFGSFPSIDDVCKPQFDKVILPVIRRVMPSIIAHDIIGVQPMTGPTASIFALRAKYAESKQDDETDELE